MGPPLQLRGEIADYVRERSAELGFEDPQTYLRWLVERHEEGEIADASRLERIESRLDDLEARMDTGGGPAADQDGRSKNERVREIIDDELSEPDGADDSAISEAISEVERELD
jgi:hypothetical protein